MHSIPSKLPSRLVLLTAIGLLLASCQTTTPTAATDSAAVCTTIFPKISYSRNDTEQTQVEIREHNAVWDFLNGIQ